MAKKGLLRVDGELEALRLLVDRREATSANGSVLGPWVQHDEPPWARNGGHGMIFTDSTGGNRLVFHWPNETPNERVRIVNVRISDEGIHLLERSHG